MPIIRFKNKIVYFSHIPKCGGTSVENFLKIIVGTNLSFLDQKSYEINSSPWSMSSAQHITGHHVSKLFPETFFDEFFTVIRNPFDRFCSAFAYQKYVFKRINPKLDVNQFADNLEYYKALHLGQFDNHFLPQINFLYPGVPYKAFKLENGLDGVKKYIGSIFDIDVSDVRMPHSLKQPNEIGLNSGKLDNNSKRIIMKIYKTDFEKFNY